MQVEICIVLGVEYYLYEVTGGEKVMRRVNEINHFNI